MESLMVIIKLMGGLGLFIYGMKLMGDGLENAAGDGLKSILEKVTKNPLISVLVGAAVTAVIQSSSATTVMVVGFVNAGLMNLAQAAGIIMGANIGTTITAQLVAFKLDTIAPLFVFVGAFIVMFAKGKKRKDIGNIVLGFGILFTGMGAMSEAMKPLTASPIFQQILLTVGEKWYLGIIAGALLTAVLQSSSATTGILVALATAGAIDIRMALPIIFGCNIGTCITAMIATVGTNKTAHKAAMLHLIFNLGGTILFIPFLVTGLLGDLVSTISPDDVSRQIANSHTVFNVVNTLVMLPLTGALIKIVNRIIPGDDEEDKPGPKYIDDRLLETPVIAAGQVIKETIRMANKAKKSLNLAMDAFDNNDEVIINKVYENETVINTLNEAITNYLVKLSKCELSDKESVIVASTFHVINDIERIGDHAENIADLAAQKIAKKLDYSNQAREQLHEIYDNAIKALEIAIESYANRDINKAKSIVEVESNIDKFQKKYIELHIKRLYDGTCNAYAGTIFLDLLSNLERIGDHSTNIAESVIENN
ncbi:Na/Pi cotransporter family protein [Clostridium chauvoei]|uniref:Na/Pi cotransporter family protein n=1 Tax=Clostridium chauvoei TaxID=46867 RepID=UPI001C8627DA|nr:Na/Pi cotransporter family protein [Clostridium chauvoei]MBX7341050.1 Na/Pi cotransporter family protein [Clostridium chauvoei]